MCNSTSPVHPYYIKSRPKNSTVADFVSFLVERMVTW